MAVADPNAPVASPLGAVTDPTLSTAPLGTGAVGAPAASVTPPPAGQLPPMPSPTPGSPVSNPHPGASVVPQSMQLPKNPQLVDHPLNGNTDADYEAQHSILAADISRRYNDVLQQLGYMDPSSGGFIPGTVETEANRQRADLQRSIGLADEDVTHQAQQEGTLFSGLRGTNQARAEHPFVSSLADLDVSVPQKLADLYGQGSDIVAEYTRQNNLLLAEAARRRAAAISANPVVGVDPNAPTTTPTTTPIPDPTPISTDMTTTDTTTPPPTPYDNSLVANKAYQV